MSFRRDRIETLGDSPSERSPGLDNRALGALSSTNGKEKTTHSTTNGKNGRSNRSRSPRRDRVETLSDSPSKRPPGLDNRALGTLSSTNGKEKTAHSTTNGKEKNTHSTTNGKNGRSSRSRSLRRDRVETLSDSPSERSPGLDNRALGTLSSTNGKEKTAHSTTNGKEKNTHSTTNGKNGRSSRSRSLRRDRVETLSDSPSERSPGLDNRALGALSSTNGKEESRPQLDQRKKENRSQHYQRKRENHSQLDQRKNRLVEPVSGACEGNRVETPVTMPGHWDPQTTPRSKDQP